MIVYEKTVDKYLGCYWGRRNSLRVSKPGCHGRFRVTLTRSGGKIVWSLIENQEGWWAVMCFYDSDQPRVDFYDRHVFDRYRDRFLMTPEEKNREEIVEKFLIRDNAKGIMFVDRSQKFAKRITDGACFGEIEHSGKVIYHKTYIPESLIDKDSQGDLLDPEYINYYVDNRRENV